MDLIKRIENEVESRTGFRTGVRKIIVRKIIKEINDLVETLKMSSFEKCLIYPPKTCQTISSITINIDYDCYIIFRFDKLDKSVKLNHLICFLELETYPMVKEILFILSNKDSTFELR